MASMKEIVTGSPGCAFTKLALLETIVVIGPSKFDWVRYSFIHAPERFPARA